MAKSVLKVVLPQTRPRQDDSVGVVSSGLLKKQCLEKTQHYEELRVAGKSQISGSSQAGCPTTLLGAYLRHI